MMRGPRLDPGIEKEVTQLPQHVANSPSASSGGRGVAPINLAVGAGSPAGCWQRRLSGALVSCSGRALLEGNSASFPLTPRVRGDRGLCLSHWATGSPAACSAELLGRGDSPCNRTPMPRQMGPLPVHDLALLSPWCSLAAVGLACGA